MTDTSNPAAPERNILAMILSVMSHELRTPLAAIQLANSSLKTYGERMSQAERQEAHQTIEQQVEYLSELVSDVMSISRTDYTARSFNPQAVDLETYCRDAVESLQLAHRLHSGIQYIGPGKRVEAKLDSKLLRRALTNLLNNAIKYSPEGRTVTLELCPEADQVKIHIRDHGIGIPEADMLRLFEPFYRASNVGAVKGTGLGLAIARQAVELHGGCLQVESQVGVGTTFTIVLPYG